MSNLSRVLLTSFLTVFTGTSVYVVGQIIQNFVLEPLKEYKKTIGEIDNKLKYYSNKFSPSLSKQTLNQTSEEIRKLSCYLEAAYKQIPFKNFFIKAGFIPTKDRVASAASNLILISNLVSLAKDLDEAHKRAEEVRKSLNIPYLQHK